MRIRERILLLFLIGGATTALQQRGAFHRFDVPLHDAALAATSPLPSLLSGLVTIQERCRVVAVTPRDRERGFTLEEVTDVLRRLGKRPNATCWIALPTGLAFTDEKALANLGKALHLLGRVGLAWPKGEARTTRAGLDRVGNASGLPLAPGFEELPSVLENSIEFVTADRLEPSVDGRLRALALAEHAGEKLLPAPPVAIAASVLHESSIALSRDALTLESFGGRDHPLAAENLVRIQPRARSHPILTLEQALESPVDKKDPPILLVAFEGTAALVPVAIPWLPERPMIQVVADTTEDLLRARTPYRAPWYSSFLYLTSSAATGAFAADRRRRFVLLPLALAVCSALGLLGLALSSGLPPLAAMLGAVLLGFAVAGRR